MPLDRLIEPDHPARSVWRFVEGLDLSLLYDRIRARENTAGRDPHWRDHVLFYEYFDGDTGRGLGDSHQTGWTALVACLLEDCARGRETHTVAGRESSREAV